MISLKSVVLLYTENCVDRHAEDHPERVAIIWERDEPGDTQFTTYKSAASDTSFPIHTSALTLSICSADNCWRVRVGLPMC